VPIAAGALTQVLRLPALADIPGVPAVFEEILASQSGIHWKHVAGKTPEKRLPEISGAGCAFLDYDNDGWMDIYLVNSGKCDFLDPRPPLKNALYKNNRLWT
jgi:enediyne biosynthesis protein E4